MLGVKLINLIRCSFINTNDNDTNNDALLEIENWDILNKG